MKLFDHNGTNPFKLIEQHVDEDPVFIVNICCDRDPHKPIYVYAIDQMATYMKKNYGTKITRLFEFYKPIVD